MTDPDFGTDNHADKYVTAIQDAQRTYQDAIDAVSDITGAAAITQLGGMLAIESIVEGGRMWVTDLNNNLPGDCDDHEGWDVGIYAGEMDEADSPEPTVVAYTEDPSIAALQEAVRDALRQFSRTTTRRSPLSGRQHQKPSRI